MSHWSIRDGLHGTRTCRLSDGVVSYLLLLPPTPPPPPPPVLHLRVRGWSCHLGRFSFSISCFFFLFFRVFFFWIFFFFGCVVPTADEVARSRPRPSKAGQLSGKATDSINLEQHGLEQPALTTSPHTHTPKSSTIVIIPIQRFFFLFVLFFFCFFFAEYGRIGDWILNQFLLGFYWVSLGFTVLYWVFLGCTGFYWVLLGCKLLCWLCKFCWVS